MDRASGDYVSDDVSAMLTLMQWDGTLPPTGEPVEVVLDGEVIARGRFRTVEATGDREITVQWVPEG